MNIAEWVKETEDVELTKDNKYSEMHKFYTVVRQARATVEKLVARMKKKEGDIKNTLMEKLDTDELPSVKTEFGTIFTKVSKHVTTEDTEALLNWIRREVLEGFYIYLIAGDLMIREALEAYLARKEGHTDCLYLLKKNPCTEAAIKELSEENETLPPGLKWFSKRELNFRK